MSGKLLFDQNISRRIAGTLPGSFAGSRHVTQLRLGSNTDRAIWDYARTNGFAIVSKDAAPDELSVRHAAEGHLAAAGHCTTDDIVRCLVHNEAAMSAFLLDPESALLVLES